MTQHKLNKIGSAVINVLNVISGQIYQKLEQYGIIDSITENL